MKLADSKVQPRAVIIGSGTTGRVLLERLAASWVVAIVDKDPAKLELISSKINPERVHRTAGDGTSRLVLEAAGIEQADNVIAVTGSDEVNLEICRIAREDYSKTNIYAAVARFANRKAYREAGIDFVTPSFAAAVSLEHRVLRGIGTSLSAAEARGEVIEVSVLPSSPMIGRSLSSVRSRRWHVGAIYRDEKLVIPTGPTRIEEHDRVVLIGEKEVLPAIAEFFRLGEPEFPLEFGTKVIVLTESSSHFEQIADELRYLLDHSRARAVEVLFWPHEPGIHSAVTRILAEHNIDAKASAVFGKYGDVTAKHVVGNDCGVLLVPDERFRFLERLGLRRTALSSIFRRMDSPIAVLRGSFPYRKILLPVTEAGASMPAARLAFDLARIHKASVTTVTVTAPRFVVGSRAIDEQRAALTKISHLANLYHLSIDQVHREGNPIEEMLKLCPDFQLVVMSHGKDRKPSFFNPDVSQHLVRRAPVSTLVLPV